MELAHQYLFQAIWLSWLLLWLFYWRKVKPVVRQESFASKLLHNIPLILAALLLLPEQCPIPILNQRFMQPTSTTFWVGALITFAGLVFSIWARFVLGRNWSSTVTVKKDHELITRGPYSLVRHPIYTGILMAFVGSAIARSEWRGPVAAILAFLGLWQKLRTEERFMREQFADRYLSYCKRVRALIPFFF